MRGGRTGVGRVMAAIACLTLGSCGKKTADPAWWDGERERVELQSRLDLLKLRSAGADTHGLGDLSALRGEAERLAQTRDRFSEERLALLTDLGMMESEAVRLAADRLKAARAAALGRQFGSFSTVGGKTYENVKVVKVDDGGVSIRHADGAATLRYGDLTADQREAFGIERESALAAEMREARDAAEYEDWMSREMAVVEERSKELASVEAGKSALESARRASLARVDSPRRSSPLSKPATPFGNGSIWRNSWYGSYYDGYPYRRRTVTYYTPSSVWYPQSNYPSSGSPSCGRTGSGNLQNDTDVKRREVIR